MSMSTDMNILEGARTLIELCCIQCTENRLRAVLSAHPVNQASTKSKRLKLLTKAKNRVSECNPAALQRFIDLLASLTEADSDRVLTVLAYLIDNSQQSAQSTLSATPASTRTAALLNRANQVTNTAMLSTSPSDQSMNHTFTSSRMARSLSSAINSTSSFTISSAQARNVQTDADTFSHPTNISSDPAVTMTANLPHSYSQTSASLNAQSLQQTTSARSPSPHIAHTLPSSNLYTAAFPIHSTTDSRRPLPSQFDRSSITHSHPTASHIDMTEGTSKTTAALRVHNDDNATDLCFGDTITIHITTPFKHFLSLESAACSNTSQSSSSSRRPHIGSSIPFSFVIRNAKNLDDRSPVRYLDTVMISVDDQPNTFLQSARSNDLVVSDIQSSNSNQLNAAKFTVYAGRPVRDEVLAASNASTYTATHMFLSIRSNVKNGDDVILKSSSGLYVTADEPARLNVDSRHQIHNEVSSTSGVYMSERVTGLSQVFVVHRAHLPIMDSDLKQLCELSSSRFNAPSMSAHAHSATQPDVSESALVDDVLSCLLGLEGEFLRPVLSVSGTTEWHCDDRVLDVSHRTLLNDRLLPLAHDYSVIHHYLIVHRRHEFGMVHHALTRAIQSIMEEYHVLIGQLDVLDRNSLTLTRLAYHLSSVQRTLRRLVTVVQTVNDCMGGAVIDALHRQLLQAGESNHRAVLLHLLQNASAPFLDMLSTWLHAGTFSDQHMEFCVVIDQSISQSQLLDDFNATYWSSRWQFRHDRCPSFLKQHQDRILATGKYWNVLRQCSQASTRPRNINTKHHAPYAIQATLKQSQSAALMLASGISSIPSIPYSENDGVIVSLIDSAYGQASRSLINLLLHDYALIERFTLMKHIYLLGAGDWLVHFMDAAWAELSAPAHTINRSKLQSLLDLSFSSSTSIVSLNQALDQSVDNKSVTVALQQHRFDTKLNAIYQATDAHIGSPLSSNTESDDNFEPPNLIDMRPLTGLDTLTLNYQVDYPLSLILSKTSLTKYQLCFKLLLQLKFMERECSQIFMEQKSSKAMRWYSKPRSNDRNGESDSNQRKEDINLTMINHMFRHQVLSFLRNLLYYFTAEVIEPEFQGFVSRIEAAANFDTVLNDHLSFLDSICSKLLLTDMVLLNALLKIVYCIQNYFILLRQKVQAGDAQSPLNGSESRSNPSNDNNDINGACYFDIEQVEMFQAEFHDLMSSFMQILSEKNQAMTYALIQRLDYNGWYQTAQQSNERFEPMEDSQMDRM